MSKNQGMSKIPGLWHERCETWSGFCHLLVVCAFWHDTSTLNPVFSVFSNEILLEALKQKLPVSLVVVSLDFVCSPIQGAWVPISIPGRPTCHN